MPPLLRLSRVTQNTTANQTASIKPMHIRSQRLPHHFRWIVQKIIDAKTAHVASLFKSIPYIYCKKQRNKPDNPLGTSFGTYTTAFSVSYLRQVLTKSPADVEQQSPPVLRQSNRCSIDRAETPNYCFKDRSIRKSIAIMLCSFFHHQIFQISV